MLCSHSFILYISNNGNKIKLTLLNLDKGDIFIECDNQKVILSSNKVFNDVYFEISNSEYVSFKVFNSINESVDRAVLLKDVKVINA